MPRPRILSSIAAGAALFACAVAPCASGASAADGWVSAEGAAAKARGLSVAEGVVVQPAAAVRDYWSAKRLAAATPRELGPEAGLERGPVARSANESTADAPSYARGHPAGDARPFRLRTGPAEGAAQDGPAESAAQDLSEGSSQPNKRVHGKVFFTLAGADYVCSATVVASASHAVVWTAGHCVHGADLGGSYATNWIFIPGYRGGERPFGTWPARELLTTQGWRDAANVRLDLGAAVLARNRKGRGVEDVVGARGIAFNQSRDQSFDAFGYPAVDPNSALLPPDFDGERLWRCRSPRTANDSPSPASGPATMEISCDMTGGSSGGGWVIEDEFVNSVTSYAYAYDLNHLYGPYLGGVAADLFRRASGRALLCTKKPVTSLGTPGANDLAGSAGRDVFRLLAGADRARGRGGDDRACGGGGRDRLMAGAGRDRLRGGSGADRIEGGGGADRIEGGGGEDVLRGGPGRDRCVGGPGRDRAFSCEVKRRI